MSNIWLAPRDTIYILFIRLSRNIANILNRSIAGRLAWGRGASAGTIRAREKPIPLNGKYGVRWKDYSRLDSKGMSTFRYLLVDIMAGGINETLPA